MPQDWEVPFAKLSGQVDAVDAKTERILRHLEGNGQPGLLTKVDRSEIAIGELKKEQYAFSDDRRWLWRTVIGAVIVAALGLTIQLIRAGERESHLRPVSEARP